jgi:crotonobetainyl-CoA:carnitine CoA-transferase CaiB-like acyl-CoA transferase
MGLYPTADGHLNVAAAWGQLWVAFCEVIGRPELPSDERFAHPADRMAHHDELTEIITVALSERSTSEWVDALNEVGVPAGPVNDMAQTFADPQVQHLGVASPVQHPVAGDIEIIGNATTLEGVPDTIRRPSPLAGEHTAQILHQFGFEPDEVQKLSAQGVVTDTESSTDRNEDHP